MVDRPELRNCEPLYEYEGRIKRQPERVPALFEAVIEDRGSLRFIGLRFSPEAAVIYQSRVEVHGVKLVPIAWKNRDGADS